MNFTSGMIPLGRIAAALLFAIFICIPGLSSSGQSIENARVDFHKVKHAGGDVEKISGTLYHRAPDWMLIQVKEPVTQWMLLTGNQMLLYYPETKKVYEITNSRRSMLMPFYMAFLSAGKEDFGLSQNGFTMANYSIEEGRLISTWTPPPQLQNILGDIILEFLNSKLISVRMLDLKGKLLNETFFSNHVSIGSTHLPMKILIKKENHSGFSDEISFSNFSFNVPFPEGIVDFHIPENLSIEKIIW